MATRLAVVAPNLNDCKTYENYKRELKAWANVTDIPKTKQGNVIALSLPNSSEMFGNDIKEKVLDNLTDEELSSAEGLKKLIEYLDNELGIDEMDDNIQKWSAFDNCRRQDEQNLDDFIAEYEMKSRKVLAAGVVLPNEILGYMLMERSNLSDLERALVISKLDMKDKANFYKNVKLHMKNILGKRMKQGSETTMKFKLDPVLLAQNEDVLASYGYYKNKNNGFKGKKQRFERKDKNGKPLNPKGSDGRLLTCRGCGSFRHLVKQCEHNNEKSKSQVHSAEDYDDKSEESVNMTEELESDAGDFEVERFVLFTSDKEELSKFTSEAINSAALDTCCTSTVAGEKWLKIYLDSLPDARKSKVRGPFKGEKHFQFGNQGIMKSKARYILPAKIAGKETFLSVDIIASDIPMLLSKPDMKKRGMILYMAQDQAEIFGQMVHLGTTSAGHYVMPLLEDDNWDMLSIEAVFAVNLKDEDENGKFKALKKLHAQFGHRPKQAFINLLKSANVWEADMSSLLEKIISGCEGCIKRKRCPDKPAVSIPMASDFNEKVAIDLKIWKGNNILYMIDMWSRLTIATVIKRKKPADVVDAIMKNWVAVFGVMGTILSDNGGEFTGEEMRVLKNQLNVIEMTTGAESPWQNGLCEKNHALADNILNRIHEDNPQMDLDSKLAWVCMAKNSLQMVYGYSPHQLVFGRNPKLPNVITDGPPAWNDKNMSEALNKHLTTLHATRKAFIASESCHKLKTALRSKIRTSDQHYEHGDYVYYRREKDDQWIQGKVIFQDGKVVFIRHGAYFVKASVNRVVKAGDELSKQLKENDLSKDLSVLKGVLFKQQAPSESVLSKEYFSDGNAGSNDVLSKEYHVDKPSNQESTVKWGISKDNTCKLTRNEPPVVSFFDNNEAEHIDDSEQTPLDSGSNQTVDDGQTSIPTAMADDRTPKNKILLRRNDLIRYKDQDSWNEATILSRGKVSGKHKNWFNIRRTDGQGDLSVNLEEVEYELVDTNYDEEVFMLTIPKNEQNTEACLAAKQVELKKLQDFDTYTVVPDENQNRISCTWVVGWKNNEVRARLVARGYEEDDDIPKDSPTLAKSTLRTILCLSSSFSWEVETTDIKSAFLQGSRLDRDIFIKPPKEAGLKDKLWKLNKCLYGLKDASRQWYFKVRETLLGFDFKQSTLDPGLFLKHKDGELIGFVGLHVDDFIHAGNDWFQRTLMPEVLKGFNVGKSEKGSFMYTGFLIQQDENGITLDQSKYVESLEIQPIDASRLNDSNRLLTDAEISSLRKMTGSLNWAVRATRPDLAFNMIQLSTRFKTGTVKDLVNAKKTLLNLKSNKAVVRFPKLGNPENMVLICFTDAALGTLNNDIDSTGGYIIFACNKEKSKCAALDWQSNKIKRVAKSTLTAEALVLCEGLEASIYLSELLAEFLNIPRNKIEIHGVTDNMSVLNAIQSTTAVSDRRLRREIGAIKEMVDRKEVSSIKWVPGSKQLADVLTKKGVNGAKLLETLQEGRFKL